MSQSEETASLSPEALAFKTQIETFLHPLTSISHLSGTVQTLEAKYRKAHDIIFSPSPYSPPVDDYRLQCIAILSLIDPFTQIGVCDAEIFEYINLMARCSLLEAMFHYDTPLLLNLSQCMLSAKELAADLEKPRFSSLEKSAREEKAKGLREVEMLCAEMLRRIKAEIPRDRWTESEGVRKDGRPYEWVERMGDEWLTATDKVEGVQDGK
ncbi:MAG: hypothetical protein LQ348_006785 [Seirophora lacunosa]|nr:MAG: hypothetical protein LQ348_006785 [Seirophora lacunosa]